MNTIKKHWKAYIPSLIILLAMMIMCFTSCYSHSDLFLVPPSTFVKIENSSNLYYVPDENNIVYYINYSWSGEQGYGIMEVWRNGDNDEIYHYNVKSKTMYTLSEVES